MHAVELAFAVGWAAFWIYWLVAAFSMKKGRVPWSRELRIRAVVFVLAILLIRLGAFRDGGINSDPWRAGLGLFLFALGPGFGLLSQCSAQSHCRSSVIARIACRRDHGATRNLQ
jgi:hypothetical protein